MCGIAGVIGFEPNVATGAARSMARALSHRGPDDEGVEQVSSAPTVVLAHRRLSVIDRSPLGHQPMPLPERGLWLTYNGEIYNFRALREELRQLGARFQGNSDTEILLHAYAHWGMGCVERLHGMFAFALFDPREGCLFLARDGLGIKPLYYALSGKSLLFASEVKALEASGLLEMKIDVGALAGVFSYGATVSPSTIYQGVSELRPGTWMRVALDESVREFKAQPFWAFPTETTSEVSPESLRALLKTTLSEHLVSDVPVGVFLSSGLDSTSIAALASQVRGGDVDTFTVGFGTGEAIDEADIAARTAKALGVRHHNIQLTDAQLLSFAEDWLKRIDQPGLDGLNTFIISKAVRDCGVVVALSGLGGDELFGGYETFRDVPRMLKWARWAGFIPPELRRRVAELALLSRGETQRQKGMELAAAPPSVERLYLMRRRLLSNLDLEALGLQASDLGLDADFLPPCAREMSAAETLEPHHAVRMLESSFYMRNTLLRDSDVFGMAHGLEIRVPFLDRKMVELACQIPGEALVKARGPNKHLLAAAVAKDVSAEVREGPKRGFSLPYARWMMGPLRPLFEHRIAVLRDSGLVDPSGVERIWKGFLAHPEGPSWSRAWVLGVVGAFLDRRSGAVS